MDVAPVAEQRFLLAAVSNVPDLDDSVFSTRKQSFPISIESNRPDRGSVPQLPSGPLHDASEMAAVMPTVMVFAQSSPGISHCKEENTPAQHLDTSIRAFLRLVEYTVAHVAKS